MPIIYQKEPKEATEAIRTGLQLMSTNRAFSTPRLRRALAEEAEAPEPAQALPVYNLGLSDIGKSRDIGAAVHTGWRYAIRQNKEIVANGETIIDPQGRHHFAATNEGPLVEGTTRAIEAAEAEGVVKKGKYEVRFLQVPALYVTALWLVDKSGKADLAIPVEPTPPPLVANKLMPFADLLAILQEKAKSISAAEMEDEALGGG
jgi:hypothetical protein